MKQNGDSNAAAALQQVTGLTVVPGGRYVFVRGLGDRYITTLLNGLQLPSPEPEKRVIPLDIFPAGVFLEQMTIAKTLSPDLPGAFGGGTILLKTKTLPEKDFLQIGAGFTFNQRAGRTTKRTFWGLTTVHGNCLRKWRRPRKKAPFCAAADGFPTRDFPTRSWPRWGKFLPVIGFLNAAYGHTQPKALTLSGGKRYETNGVKWGVLSGWTYRVQDTIIERTTRTYETGVTDLQLRNRADVLQSQQRVSLAGLFSLGAQLNKNNSVQAITLITRISDKTANVVNSFFNITDSPYSNFYTRQLDWVNRMLLSQQFIGNHPLFNVPDWKLNWLRVLHRRSRATRSPHRGLRPRPRRHRVPVARRIRRQRTLFLRPFRSGPPPRRRHPQQRFGAQEQSRLSKFQHRLELFFQRPFGGFETI